MSIIKTKLQNPTITIVPFTCSKEAVRHNFVHWNKYYIFALVSWKPGIKFGKNDCCCALHETWSVSGYLLEVCATDWNSREFSWWATWERLLYFILKRDGGWKTVRKGISCQASASVNKLNTKEVSRWETNLWKRKRSLFTFPTYFLHLSSLPLFFKENSLPSSHSKKPFSDFLIYMLN